MNLDYEREEADFLTRLHDRQMNAKSLQEKLYYRMNKELSPAIIRIFQEIETTHHPTEEAKRRELAEAVQAMIEWMATAIATMSVQLGIKDEEGGNASKIAQVMAQALVTSLAERMKPKQD